MRFFAVLCCLVAVGVLAGCSLGPDDELRTLVKGAALPASSSFDCEWGSSSFESEPKSWYGCWDYVPGDLRRVSRRLQLRIIAQGFAVWRRTNALSVQFSAIRGADVLCVDILARGFAHARNTSPSEVDISPGQVFVDMWTTKPRESPIAAARPPCAGLPAFPE